MMKQQQELPMDKTGATGPTNQRILPVYWVIGIFIFVNTMICYFDRVIFSVAAPTIMKYFNWDMGIMGMASPCSASGTS